MVGVAGADDAPAGSHAAEKIFAALADAHDPIDPIDP
jgi:hypothetical protein